MIGFIAGVIFGFFSYDIIFNNSKITTSIVDKTSEWLNRKN